MLNSLANHGFIAHTGLNISIDDLVDGIDLALNLAPNSSLPVAQLAVTTSTTGNPSTLNLDDLDKHGGAWAAFPRAPLPLLTSCSDRARRQLEPE